MAYLRTGTKRATIAPGIPFIAKFDGVCAVCKKETRKGQMIAKCEKKYGYRHEYCAETTVSFRSKYEGLCKVCGGTIPEGSQIVLYLGAHGHTECIPRHK